MTAAALMAGLAARGIRVTAQGETLRVDAPRGMLTTADREALLAHKATLLAGLRARFRATIAIGESWADDVPDGPCGLCGHPPLCWVEDWPTVGEIRWLCAICAAWPTPSLAEVFAGLTADERHRLDAEVASGDHLSVAVLRELGGDPRSVP